MTTTARGGEAAGRPTIRAAGGVLWRLRGGRLELALVHRPKYDDWTFPKGKLEPGESDFDAAVREVAEETGYQGAVGPYLGTISYERQGRPKVVHYWAVEARGEPDETSPAFRGPQPEVAEVRWLTPDAAATQLSYARDVELLQRFLNQAGAPSTSPASGYGGG